MLEAIVASARRRADAAAASAREHRSAARDTDSARPFASLLRGPSLAIVAEFKRRSPSAGSLAEGADAVTMASGYREAGAAAVSILTDPDHFEGSLDDLASVTAGVDIPVLRKDFLLDPAQIWEARAAGADAVLLIVALLDDRCLDEMLAASADAGLEALVEVHRRPELRRALDAGASLIGVNNRDLETFQTDLGVAERLAHDLEGFNGVAVAESGVSTKAGAARMRAAGYDAILVGEALMRSSAPAALIGSLRGAA